jgi:hypothetical protein
MNFVFGFGFCRIRRHSTPQRDTKCIGLRNLQGNRRRVSRLDTVHVWDFAFRRSVVKTGAKTQPAAETRSKWTLTGSLFELCLPAKMSFRPLNLDICRAGVAGLICLACAGLSRAQDMRPQPIEIVPLHGSVINTNIDDSRPIDAANLDGLSPRAPHPFRLPQNNGALPPPPRTSAPSAQERDLLDRRQNWVFMTPEDAAGTDQQTDSGGYEKDGTDKKPATALQRYFQRLYDSDRSTGTNQLGKIDSDSWTKITNSVTVGGAPSGLGVLNTVSDPGIFEPARKDSFSDVFSGDTGAALPSPEAVRLKAEQEAHMDSFKQLWNIDQPTVAAAPASAPEPVIKSSGPIFGSTQPVQPALNPPISFGNALSAGQNIAPPQSSLTSSRNATPPRPDFSPPQRPF